MKYSFKFKNEKLPLVYKASSPKRNYVRVVLYPRFYTHNTTDCIKLSYLTKFP